MQNFIDKPHNNIKLNQYSYCPKRTIWCSYAVSSEAVWRPKRKNSSLSDCKKTKTKPFNAIKVEYNKNSKFYYYPPPRVLERFSKIAFERTG